MRQNIEQKIPPAHAAIDAILQQALRHFAVACASHSLGAASAGFATKAALNAIETARVLLAKLSETDAETSGAGVKPDGGKL